MRGLVLLVALAACGGGDDKTEPANTADTSSASTEPVLPCERPDIMPRAFDEGEGGVLFGELAADFTVNLVDDEVWTLSENWTGCDSYIFVTHWDDSEGDTLWSSDGNDLLTAAPSNAHIFFVSMASAKPDRRRKVEEMRDSLTLGAKRKDRVHFVTDRLDKIDGSVGAMVSDYMDYQPQSGEDLGDRGTAYAPDLVMFGIDVEQRWDPGGNIDNFVGGTPTLEMAGYLGHFYNHKAELAERLANEEGVTEAVLVDEEVTSRIFVETVDLPADLSGFDTLEFDVQVICEHRNPFACSEWDRNARIELCVDGEECADRRELVRWITPYWRRGERRWAMDASQLLPLLSGGRTSFRIEMGPDWERGTARKARMAVRLSTRGVPRPTGAELVYRGANFDSYYNERDPVLFTPPAGATRVELVSIVSGHGQDGSTNCSEWCDHRHHFTINGAEAESIVPESGIGSLPGCALMAKKGVSPGQWGNWAALRAYWCPGLPVEPITTDLTAHAIPGAENTLDYTATLGERGEPGGGNIDLSTYVVWYE